MSNETTVRRFVKAFVISKRGQNEFDKVFKSVPSLNSRADQMTTVSTLITLSKNFVMTEKFRLNFPDEILLELSGSLFSGQSCQKIKIKRSFKSFFHRDQHFSIYKEKFFWFNVTVTCLSRQKRYVKQFWLWCCIITYHITWPIFHIIL